MSASGAWHIFVQRIRRLLRRTDTRLLLLLAALAGLAAWFVPWPWVGLLAPCAALLACVAYSLLPRGKTMLAAYGLFLLLWVAGRHSLELFETPGAFGPALQSSVVWGIRLAIMLGFALTVPLASTPVGIGRAVHWCLHSVAQPRRRIWSLWPLRKIRPSVERLAWQASLAMAVMLAFIPKTAATLAAQRTSLSMRCPNMPIHRRLHLLGLGVLRALSQETWDMSLSIASRGVYRAEPWQWRKMARE